MAAGLEVVILLNASKLGKSSMNILNLISDIYLLSYIGLFLCYL